MRTDPAIVSISARPAPIAIDRNRSAVIVVDMQNDFGSKGGMFDRARIDIAPIVQAVEPTANVLAAARKAGIPVIYLQMQHRADLADMGASDSPHRQRHARLSVGERMVAPDGKESRILIAGEWGTKIIDALTPQSDDIVVPKHRFSGFFETELNLAAIEFSTSLNSLKYAKNLICRGNRCFFGTFVFPALDRFHRSNYAFKWLLLSVQWYNVALLAV